MFELFGLTFGIIDIVIVVIVLFFFLKGVLKGFINLILTTFQGIISFVVAYALCRPFSAITKEFMYQPIYDKLFNWMATKGELFTTIIPNDPLLKEQVIKHGLSELNIPTIFQGKFVELISGIENQTLGDAISIYLTDLLVVVIAFIMLLIIVRLALLILRKIFGEITKRSTIGAIDRFLGAIAGLVMGIVIVGIITSGITFMISSNIIPSAAEWLISDMHLNDDSVVCISKIVYNNNPIIYILQLLQKQ